MKNCENACIDGGAATDMAVDFVRPGVLDAFHMMWDLHPAPVMLVRKDRTIVAVNAVAVELGIHPGIRCHTLAGNAKMCPQCKGNVALRMGQATRALAFSEGQGLFLDGYWTPVAGETDLFVHYGNDITECVRPELLVPACRDDRGE